MNLDYQKIAKIAHQQTSTQKSKLKYEFQFALIAITTFLIFGMSRVAVLGSIAILRRLWKKLLKTEFFHSNPLVFNIIFGIYCLDALYLFCVTFRSVSLTSQVLMCYQLAMYCYVGQKLTKERHYTLEYSLKNIMFREIDLTYIYALTYLEQVRTFAKLFLIICFLAQLFIFQMSHLINHRGELLKQRAKGLSLWLKLHEKPHDNVMVWNAQQEKYPPNVNVLYNNNYYRLQNLYNTSPPEDIKAIFIQLLFYNPQRTKRWLGIFMLLFSVLSMVLDLDCWIFNIVLTFVVMPQLQD